MYLRVEFYDGERLKYAAIELEGAVDAPHQLADVIWSVMGASVPGNAETIGHLVESVVDDEGHAIEECLARLLGEIEDLDIILALKTAIDVEIKLRDVAAEERKK